MAASKKKASRKTRATALDATPRHLWLASLGMLVAARRESGVVASRATRKLEESVADARHAIRRADAGVRAGLDGMRSQLAPRVQTLAGEVEARLAPIITRLGRKPKARKTRAGTTKGTRRAVRKPAPGKRAAAKAAR